LLSQLFSNPAAFLRDMLIILPAIVIGISVHEFGHAFTADRLGDPTPRNQGRVTLSPFAHIDPWGLLMLFLFRFGYGRAVQVNPANFKNRKRDQVLVYLSGVTMNLIVAFIAYFVYVLLRFRLGFYNTTVLSILLAIVVININLIIFNLLPIPPLDGYGVVRSLFLHKNINLFWKLDQYGFLILIVLLLTDVLTPFLWTVNGAIIGFIDAIVGLIL
jgi:Zn-dependent protease